MTKTEHISEIASALTGQSGSLLGWFSPVLRDKRATFAVSAGLDQQRLMQIATRCIIPGYQNAQKQRAEAQAKQQ